MNSGPNDRPRSSYQIVSNNTKWWEYMSLAYTVGYMQKVIGNEDLSYLIKHDQYQAQLSKEQNK